MLLPTDLYIDILIIIFVQSRRGEVVTDPHVNGVGFFLEGYASKGDIVWHIGKEPVVLFAEVVVL